jgi:hypothetical protein
MPPLRLRINPLYATHASRARSAFDAPRLAIKDVQVVTHEADKLDDSR